MGRDLIGWDAFAATHLAGGPKYKVAVQLLLFRSRWRLAWNFEGFNATGFSDDTVDAYAAAFKVFLAYSAHELLAESIDVPHTKLPYENHDLAARVRVDLIRLKTLTLDTAVGKQASWLTEFWDGVTNDLRPFAYGVRNVVAHGPFTGNKLKSKKSRSTLLDVAEHMLLVSEVWFGEWATVVDTALTNSSD